MRQALYHCATTTAQVGLETYIFYHPVFQWVFKFGLLLKDWKLELRQNFGLRNIFLTFTFFDLTLNVNMHHMSDTSGCLKIVQAGVISFVIFVHFLSLTTRLLLPQPPTTWTFALHFRLVHLLFKPRLSTNVRQLVSTRAGTESLNIN